MIYNSSSTWAWFEVFFKSQFQIHFKIEHFLHIVDAHPLSFVPHFSFIFSISPFFLSFKVLPLVLFFTPPKLLCSLSFYCKLLVHFVASHSSFFCAIWKDLCFYRRKFMALFYFVASHWLFFCKLQLFIKRILGWKVWSAIIVFMVRLTLRSVKCNDNFFLGFTNYSFFHFGFFFFPSHNFWMFPRTSIRVRVFFLNVSKKL
jgi:hypothetical protein